MLRIMGNSSSGSGVVDDQNTQTCHYFSLLYNGKDYELKKGLVQFWASLSRHFQAVSNHFLRPFLYVLFYTSLSQALKWIPYPTILKSQPFVSRSMTDCFANVLFISTHFVQSTELLEH